MKRYKELLYGDKTYTETYKINEILAKNGFEWFLDCEVENARLEITKNTLVFNSGVFFNGNWEYGVFRDGQWKYGTWSGGVWYNGTWYNGIYKNGLIFNGRFLNGKIEGGEIRGGDFFDIEISRDVAINVEQPSKNSPKPQQGHPVNRGENQKIQGQTQPIQTQPIQTQPIQKSQEVVESKRSVKGLFERYKFENGNYYESEETDGKEYINLIDVRKAIEPDFDVEQHRINLECNRTRNAENYIKMPDCPEYEKFVERIFNNNETIEVTYCFPTLSVSLENGSIQRKSATEGNKRGEKAKGNKFFPRVRGNFLMLNIEYADGSAIVGVVDDFIPIVIYKGKRIINDADPYGEEAWQDELVEKKTIKSFDNFIKKLKR